MSKTTTRSLRAMKRKNEKIAMLTAYDYAFARIVDQAGIDIILVGDSLGNVVQGRNTTLPVTLDEMIYHTTLVARGAKNAMVVGDMPFMSYQVSPEQALANCGRLVKESGAEAVKLGAEAVKLEGGEPMAGTISRLTSVGIPVMGHVGLTPQSVHQLGGYRVQGKKDREAERLINDALAVQQAGAFSIVLECVPTELAGTVSEKLKIPTIGIGAGVHCDGQVLVLHDLLGLTEGTGPKFVKRYAEIGSAAAEAVSHFISEVRGSEYPGDEHSY
jgi:3-methyl-2-oxobutanoate hydroxymethyltransferase